MGGSLSSRTELFAGARAALQGYRLQALYTLFRILSADEPQGVIFQPEGLEDLAIFATDGALQEVVQVKAYADNLTLSKFEPDKPTSFLRRVLKLTESTSPPTVKVVSFGPIGPELEKSWQGKGEQTSAVIAKLRAQGYAPNQIDTLLQCLTFHKVVEQTIQDHVLSFLRQSPVGGDPYYAFDLLNAWLYRASELRSKIAYNDVVTTLNSIGQYLAERAAHHQEWFTSIVPLEDTRLTSDTAEILAEEFYQGAAARYEHIESGVDVVREEKLQQIDEAFQKKRVIIVYGASGQGKSSLAYRYLHSFVPASWRFQVRLIEGRHHALRVARALSEHLRVVHVPMYVYLDVAPRDTDWPDLVRELVQYHDCRILITIREEDWKRANVSAADLLFPETIELAFDKKEAQSLYTQLAARRVPIQFLSFDEAWSRFGAIGPLLEFVHLVTQNQSLHERLHQQSRRLQDEVRQGKLYPNELQVLRLVSIASAYGARLDQKLLATHLDLVEPQRTFELFEKEYLLRQSADGRFVDGVHPIRSTILADCLTDEVFTPWIDNAITCLPVLAEEDLEVFLLHAFSRRPAISSALLHALSIHRPQTWTGVAGVVRSLLWLGIRAYVDDNMAVITECANLVGTGWWFILDQDIANVAPVTISSLQDSLAPFVRNHTPTVDNLRKRQTPKEKAFTYLYDWLRDQPAPPPPRTPLDWSGIAEVAFWVGHKHAASPILSSLTEADVEKALTLLSLQELGDVVLGLSFTWKDRLLTWLSTHHAEILRRFQQETQTITIEDDGETVRAHFLVAGEQPEDQAAEGEGRTGQKSDSFNTEVVQRVELLRKFYPHRQAYGGQGYGHQLGFLNFSHDPTYKSAIPKETIPPQWAVKVNAIFCNLADYRFRPETWQDYTQEVLTRRQSVVRYLQDLKHTLVRYFSRKKSTNLLEGFINNPQWQETKKAIGRPPALPQCAIDEWGVVSERRTLQQEIGQTGTAHLSRKSVQLAIVQHQPYVSSANEFLQHVSTFLGQAFDLLCIRSMAGKAQKGVSIELALQKLRDLGIQDTGPLATTNLGDAFKALPTFQREFRNRFISLVHAMTLTQVEKDETQLLWELWSLWYQLAFHPTQKLLNPVSQSTQKAQATLSRLREALRHNLRQQLKVDRHGRILSEEVRWEGKRALWIVFDVINPIELYSVFECVCEALKASLSRQPDHEEIHRYALEFWWPETLIIPLVKGKALTKSAWRFLTASIWWGTAFESSNVWSYIPRPIPEEIWAQLGLSVWEQERLNVVNRLQAAVASLMLVVAHLCDLGRCPDGNEVGQELLQNHLVQQLQSVATLYGEFAAAASDIVQEIQAMTPQELSEHPALMAAIEQLAQLKRELSLDTNEQGECVMNLVVMKLWLQKLQQAVGTVESIRLLWVTDVLRNETR